MTRTEQIRQAILAGVPGASSAITRAVSQRFGITRQAVSHHVQALIAAGLIESSGNTRARTLAPKKQLLGEFEYEIAEIDEALVWERDIRTLLGDLPPNVRDIWHYAVTEMVNNAIDHSGSAHLLVKVEKLGGETRIWISDFGVGIFKKIQDALGLDLPEHAVLELAKGKFTTDPDNHSGEGIFFASRAVDTFAILASGLYAHHEEGADGDWVLGEGNPDERGTVIKLVLADNSDRELGAVHDAYANPDADYVFARTIVPVDLVRYGDERVVSRSQAKRLMNRLERFHTVILDFNGIDTIGQAFADEIFRVFAAAHPNVAVTYVGAKPEVEKMIKRAKATNVHRQ